MRMVGDIFFQILDCVDTFVWSYIGIPAIMLIGVYLTLKSGCMQLVQFPKAVHIFRHFFSEKHEKYARGINPLRAFFAAIGGAIGVGGIVGVCASVQIGGPGAIFWMWVAALLGMMIKYAEIYLGISHRVKNEEDSYDGGPMYFLQDATPHLWVAKLFCVLLCVYGVEIYIFRIMTHSIVSTWHVNHLLTVALLLLAVFYSNSKGMQMVGKVNSVVVPVFLTVFCGMGFWVLL